MSFLIVGATEDHDCMGDDHKNQLSEIAVGCVIQCQRCGKTWKRIAPDYTVRSIYRIRDLFEQVGD